MNNRIHQTLLCIIFIIFTSQTLFATSKKKKYNRKQAVMITKKGIALNNNSIKEKNFYLEAIKIDPTYAAAYYNLGNIYYDKKDYKNAITHYIKAVKKNPRDKDFFFNLALAYYKNNDHVQSIFAIKKLMILDKKDYESYYLICKIYYTTEARTSLNKARIYLKQILKKTKDLDLKTMALHLLGKVERKLGLKK